MSARPVLCALALAQSVACSTSGEMLPLEIRLGPSLPSRTVPAAQRLKVGIAPFEDRRADTSRIGIRRDWLGGEALVTVEGSQLGEVIAEMAVDYVKKRQGWDAWIAKPGVPLPSGGPDVMLEGSITAFAVEAVPGLGGTDLTATVQMTVEARRLPAGWTGVVTLARTDRQRVFSFAREDLEALVNATVRKSLESFLAQVAVEGKLQRIN